MAITVYPEVRCVAESLAVEPIPRSIRRPFFVLPVPWAYALLGVELTTNSLYPDSSQGSR